MKQRQCVLFSLSALNHLASISRNCASFEDEISTSRKDKLSIAPRSNYSNMLRYLPIDVRGDNNRSSKGSNWRIAIKTQGYP